MTLLLVAAGLFVYGAALVKFAPIQVAVAGLLPLIVGAFLLAATLRLGT